LLVKGGRCVRLANLPPSSADCLEVWEPQSPGIIMAVKTCTGTALLLLLHICMAPSQICLYQDTSYLGPELQYCVSSPGDSKRLGLSVTIHRRLLSIFYRMYYLMSSYTSNLQTC